MEKSRPVPRFFLLRCERRDTTMVRMKAPATRLTLRLPKSLHAMLTKRAHRRGVSLNAIILFLLLDAIEAAAPSSERPPQ